MKKRQPRKRLAPTFLQLPIPDALKMRHLRDGGLSLKRYVAAWKGQFIRVMHGLEPTGQNQLEYHVSISIANTSDGGEPPARMPTSEECGFVLNFLGLQLSQLEPMSKPPCMHYWYKKDHGKEN